MSNNAPMSMHLYRNGDLTSETVEANSIVRIWTGAGQWDYIEVQADSTGWVRVSGHGGVVIKPAFSNVVYVKPERAS